MLKDVVCWNKSVNKLYQSIYIQGGKVKVAISLSGNSLFYTMKNYMGGSLLLKNF